VSESEASQLKFDFVVDPALEADTMIVLCVPDAVSQCRFNKWVDLTPAEICRALSNLSDQYPLDENEHRTVHLSTNIARILMVSTLVENGISVEHARQYWSKPENAWPRAPRP
jgi:hypothetical protein